MYAEVKTNYNEPRYTLEQAKQIIYQEKRKLKNDIIYSIKQKLYGIFVVLMAVIIPIFIPEFTLGCIFLGLTGIALTLSNYKNLG